jgi:predicted Zn-dependent protease
MGLIYEDQQEHTKAIETLKKVTDIDPDHMAARYRTGVILVRVGNVERGLDELKSVAKADPDGPYGKDALTEINLINKSELKDFRKKMVR